MQMSNLKPASSLANRFGVKSMIFGAPGSGKTPLIDTAPRPVLLVTEPGMLSMRHSKIPCWEGYTPKAIQEFFDWFTKSKETVNFDTLGIDSFSNLAELILSEEEGGKSKAGNEVHGKKAYGNMAKRVKEYADILYYFPQKHIVLIAKQTTYENGRQTVLQNNTVSYEPIMQKRPYFPGQALNVYLPHLFDNVMQLGEAIVPGFSTPQRALRTREIPEIFARDRLGNLNDLEPPNLNELFKKSMS